MSTGPGMSGPAIGAEFAGHRIEAVIGRGGMGIVYRARNLALDRLRALKVLTPALSADARFRERFRRESRLAASIEHPNVIPVHEAGEEEGQLYLSMRLVAGQDLRELVLAQGPLEPAVAAEIIGAVAGGLGAAHDAGLIHRDVKPANVLVGDGADAGRVYLTDFGISRTMSGGETVTGTGELVGTADFIAPEQIAGDAVDHRADIYALGGVLHFALTGRSPFPRENELATLFAHANAPRPRPSETRPDLPPRLDSVVARAMAVGPEDRFESSGALAQALAATLDDGETIPLPRPSRRPVRRGRDAAGLLRRRRGMRWRVGLAALAAVAAVAVAIVFLLGRDEEAAPLPALEVDVSEAIEVGKGPTGLTVGPERVWVAARGGNAVNGVGLTGGTTQFEIPIPAPTSVAVGDASVWAVSKTADAVYRLDPLEDTPPVEIPLGAGADPADVATDERWVWVANAGAQNVVRIDPQTNAPAGRVELGTEPRALAIGQGFVWVTNIRDASVSRIDPETPRREGRPTPVDELPNDIAVGEGAVWVTSNLHGTVTELDPATGAVASGPTPVGELPRGIKAGLGYVWIALGGEDAVVRIDPGSSEVAGEPIAVGDDPADVALAEDAVWTANEGASTITRIEP